MLADICGLFVLSAVSMWVGFTIGAAVGRNEKRIDDIKKQNRKQKFRPVDDFISELERDA